MPTKTRQAPPRREDRPGHLDPQYTASLLAQSGAPSDQDDRAFVGGSGTEDDLAEALAEEAVIAMTTGEDGLGDDLQAETEEDRGGPFVDSTGKEFAGGVDESNPGDAEREPFPKA